MPQEIEVYFPHDGIYIDVSVQDWTSTWKITCTWQHTKIRQSIKVEDIPTDPELLKTLAIQCYEKHQWRDLLRNMDADTPKV